MAIQLRKKPYRKLISDYKLFETVDIDVSTCIPYNPDHNLDEDAWFKVEQFSLQPFSIGNFNSHYDSKNYDDLTKDQFNKIAYIISVQGDDFYFQKITSSLFIKRKTVVFGEVAKVEESTNRLVINSTPDAIYFTVSDTLIFRNLVTISSIFPGIDILYKEATKEEVKEFLGESFIALANEYNVEKVSKPNRKRVALAMATLETMSAADRASMLKYIESYCEKKLKFDHTSSKFEISTDDELKLLLYGIEKRFYTTYDGHERRLANSVQPLN